MNLPPFIVDLIKQVVALIAAALFTFLLGKFPSFPIPAEVFTNFLIWFVLILLGVQFVATYAATKFFSRKQ